MLHHSKRNALAARGTPETVVDIVLERGDFRLALLPAIGGSVRSFTFGGVDILRPAPAHGPLGPLDTAAFPLFPFSGRIDRGRFSWIGRPVELAPNFPPEAHAIHGQAWLRPWTVETQEPSFARLTYVHAADDWPWAYRAEQAFRLTDEGLHLTLAITNLAHETMPAGLGWHPYFPRLDAVLTADVTGMWTAATGMIPDQLASLTPATDLTRPVAIDMLNLDNAFTAGPESARVTWPSRRLRATVESSEELRHLVVYTPQGEDFFCVEPVSHAPDAVNSAHGRDVTGLRELAAGETLSATVRLIVDRP